MLNVISTRYIMPCVLLRAKGSLYCGSGGVPQLPMWFSFPRFSNQLLMRYDLCSHAVTYIATYVARLY